ncbi:MAG: hypothetical protein Q4D16_19680 [Eubacteriales bacterium]|nr:hypothetical protein [Eubacteriales bacterium]
MEEINTDTRMSNNPEPEAGQYHNTDQSIREEKQMEKDKIVEEITQVDCTKIEVPMYAVYYNTFDYPGKYVARLYDVDKPTNIVIIKDTIEEMQEYFDQKTPFIYFRRGAGDVPELVGVWV